MNLYVKGYTICVTITVLVSMISVLMSSELHIRSILTTPSKATTSNENHAVSIDKEYSLQTYDFRRNELKSEAENRRVNLFRNYLSEPIHGIPSVMLTKAYSSINKVDTGKGFDLLFLRNVCYDAESQRVILFTDFQSNSKFSEILEKVPRQNAFASVEGKMPQVESLLYGNYMLFADNAMDEITQFSSVNFLSHFMLHATDYPTMQNVFLPFFSSSTTPSSSNPTASNQSGINSDLYEYLSILQSFYPSQRPIQLYYKEDLPDGLICFSELIIPTTIQYANEGSIHLDLYEADTVRIAAYRYYQIFSKMPVPTTAIVLHARSKAEVDGRVGTINNMEELDQFFKKKVAIWSYRTIVLDDVSKATKIHALFETDILFGIASHLFVNMIYLLPGSCVVAVSPCLLSASHLNSIAEQSQLLFLEVSNFSVPIPSACADRMSDVVGHIYSEKCLKELNQQEVYVQPGMLMSYLRVAKTYTMIHKYYDESEGEYV